MNRRTALFFGLLISLSATTQVFTHADSLKGSYGPGRTWWDALHYRINVYFDPKDSTVSGSNTITYKVLQKNNSLQIDLLEPLEIDSVIQDGRLLTYKKDGSAYFVNVDAQQKDVIKKIRIAYHGKPVKAKNPPWDGGLVWKSDKNGNPWISIACEGMAARAWVPNKDHMADEPDSVTFRVGAPMGLISVANGRMTNFEALGGKAFFTWNVIKPINNYNIIPYIGKYQNFKDTFSGTAGVLDLDFWVLEGNVTKARRHFAQVKTMLKCFEEWFGPYPFYEDGYKLVEAPYLGMEHQSAIAYGNDYAWGYMGRDLSGTGWGLKWDFLIIHESGHEWFGNNITAKDVADNWIHESFTAYAENLYTEYLFGKKAGSEYVIGTRLSVLNNKPMIGKYGVNNGGSLDVYYKGANMLHMIRQIVNNDSAWKKMLRGLNKEFRYQTVTSSQIETYMSRELGKDLSPVFDQYLRETKIPVFEFKLKNGRLSYRFSNCGKKFGMPVRVRVDGAERELFADRKWNTLSGVTGVIATDPNYYFMYRKVE